MVTSDFALNFCSLTWHNGNIVNIEFSFCIFTLIIYFYFRLIVETILERIHELYELTNIISKIVEQRTKAAERKCISTITVNCLVISVHKSIIALWRSTIPTSWVRIWSFSEGVYISTIHWKVLFDWNHELTCKFHLHSSNGKKMERISSCITRNIPLMYKQLHRKNPSTKLKVNTVQAPEAVSNK